MCIDKTAFGEITEVKNDASLQNTKKTQWLVGGIEENNRQRIFVQLVPDRKIETLYNVLCDNVFPGSIIRTDGYPSYPEAVKRFDAEHQIVNHTLGFSNEDNQTTNTIEGLWSNLKSFYRRRHGLQKENHKNFLSEFVWRKKNIPERSKKNF